MTIRPATEADLPALSPLIQQQIADHCTLLAGNDLFLQANWEEVIPNRVTDSQEGVWVADQDGTLIGYLMLGIKGSGKQLGFFQRMLRRIRVSRTAQDQAPSPSIGWIEDCYVLPQARRQGIGTALVSTALRWCENHDICRLELGVWIVNGPAQAFWEHQGFVPGRLHMAKNISKQTEED